MVALKKKRIKRITLSKGAICTGKLVRCLKGSIYDVAIDLRKKSNTFGEWAGIELSSDNNLQFWIPEGFAHGFLVMSSVADLEYKVTDYYNPDDEGCIIWNDPILNIDWPTTKPILISRDAHASSFGEII